MAGAEGILLMMQTINSLTQDSLSFKQFLDYDFPDEGRYELIDGTIVKILATQQHDNIAEFIADEFKAEVKRLDLKYRVSGRVMIRTLSLEGKEQGRFQISASLIALCGMQTPLHTLPLPIPCKLQSKWCHLTGKTTTSTNLMNISASAFLNIRLLIIKQMAVDRYLAIPKFRRFLFVC